MAPTETFTNRLAASTSPYLLQHAHNPVDWYPWGEEAFTRARIQQKPILLSIGYSACHWCHVMERESFANEDIAALMNEHFICIKVDREERPDIDDIYMAVTMNFTGQGGWPMTVFLTHEHQPFFAGTYFPPENRYGRPGFKSLLQRINDLWQHHREQLFEQAKKLTRLLVASAMLPKPQEFSTHEMERVVQELSDTFDAEWGGFGRAPKFPHTPWLTLLLLHHNDTGNRRSLDMVETTLEHMAQGGICDHFGGGFARYSTDDAWLMPHFEKMLYDNALLTGIYLHAFQVGKNTLYADVAASTCDFVLRELTLPEGGFCSALDADSEGEEGKYYLWTPAAIEAVVGKEHAAWICAYYNITENGDLEGQSVPHIREPLAQLAERLGKKHEECEGVLAESVQKLLKARQQRVPPACDDKVITSWNGMMISALACSYEVLREEPFLRAAEKAAQFIWNHMRTSEGRLWRTYRQGQAHILGYLEDYANLCQGYLDLYEASGARMYRDWALDLGTRLVQEFQTEDGAFFTTSMFHETLLMRRHDFADGALPSSHAMAAMALARLGYYYDRVDLREAALKALKVCGQMVISTPRAFAQSLVVMNFLENGPTEIILTGNTNDPRYVDLLDQVHQTWIPHRLLFHNEMRKTQGPKALHMNQSSTEPALYVCRDHMCLPPITDPKHVVAALLAKTTLTVSPSLAQ